MKDKKTNSSGLVLFYLFVIQQLLAQHAVSGKRLYSIKVWISLNLLNQSQQDNWWTNVECCKIENASKTMIMNDVKLYSDLLGHRYWL